MSETTEIEDMDNLRHMLGVSERTPRGYRNYFVAGGKDVASMERLRTRGLLGSFKDRDWTVELNDGCLLGWQAREGEGGGR